MTVVSTDITETGARSESMERLAQAPQFWKKLALRLVSQHPTEKYRWLGQTPKMREWGTGRLAKGLNSESYDVTNEEYEATIKVDRKELDDDLTGQIQIRIRELSEAAANYPDYLIEQLLINGSTAGFLAFDGQKFFDTDHLWGDSGTQSNQVSVNVVDTANPTVDEMKLAIRRAIERMMGFKDDVGDPIRIPTTGLVLGVPPTLYFNTLEAINATVITNTTNVLEGVAEVEAMAGLSSGTKFYLFKTDAAQRPFIFQDRIPLEFKAVGHGSEEEFMTNTHHYGVYARYAVAYAAWYYAIEVTLT